LAKSAHPKIGLPSKSNPSADGLDLTSLKTAQYQKVGLPKRRMSMVRKSNFKESLTSRTSRDQGIQLHDIKSAF